LATWFGATRHDGLGVNPFCFASLDLIHDFANLILHLHPARLATSLIASLSLCSPFLVLMLN